MKSPQCVRVSVILCCFAVGMTLLVLLWQQSQRREVFQPGRPASPLANEQAAVQSPAVTRKVQLPDDPRPEVQLLYRMAVAANLYNFSPEIVGIRTNTKPKIIDIGTPTHGACIAGGRLERLYSYYDGSDTRRKPEGANDWYHCTGKWSEQAAIIETLEILRRLNDTEALNAIAGGGQKCEAYPLRIATPEGKQVEVIPFYRVELSNVNGRNVVQAEFRIGTNGPVGLTDWYCWP